MTQWVNGMEEQKQDSMLPFFLPTVCMKDHIVLADYSLQEVTTLHLAYAIGEKVIESSYCNAELCNCHSMSQHLNSAPIFEPIYACQLDPITWYNQATMYLIGCILYATICGSQFSICTCKLWIHTHSWRSVHT